MLGDSKSCGEWGDSWEDEEIVTKIWQNEHKRSMIGKIFYISYFFFMKKILLLLLILACCSSTSLFASSIEHFRTQDWRHMCSIFMENEYSLCSTFGIIYDGNNVIQWEKPFFKAGWAFDNWELIPVSDEVFCVKKNEWDLWLKECKIQYVKLLDWSYLCFFPWRSDSRACDHIFSSIWALEYHIQKMN